MTEHSAPSLVTLRHPRFQPGFLSVILVGLALAWFSLTSTAWAQEGRVGLVVQFGNGGVFKGCYPYTEGMTGADLLRQAGLDTAVEYSGQGAFVCRIGAAGVGQDGCDYPREACQCQTQSLPWRYWAYWRLDGAEWTYSEQGAAGRVLRPGNVDGWAWGEGAVTSGVKPPPVTWQDLCAATTPLASAPLATSQPLSSSYPLFGALIAGLVGLWALVRQRSSR